jgi:hypothetical protein
MVELILTALPLFGAGHNTTAPTPAHAKDTGTTVQSPKANPSRPVQPACTDGRTYPLTC